MSEDTYDPPSFCISLLHRKLLSDTCKIGIGPYQITKTAIIERGIELAVEELEFFQDCRVRRDD